MSYSPLPTNPFARPTTAPGAAPPEQGMLGMFGQGAFEIPRLRVAGNTPVFIHWSVVILFGFFVFACWGWSSYLEVESRIFVTLISPVLFLLTIFLHELGHAYSYYKIYGVWVTGIYLYALGGLTVASETAGANARKSMMVVVAVSGPLINAALGGVCLAFFYGFHQFMRENLVVYFLLSFHGWAQIGLAVYNMLPGVPLDGSAALVGLFRYCMTDGKAKISAYALGVVVLLIAIVLVCVFFSISTGVFLILSLIYTGFALKDAYEREKPPASLTNPTY